MVRDNAKRIIYFIDKRVFLSYSKEKIAGGRYENKATICFLRK